MNQELRDFLPTFPDDETFAVTLTMKQHTKGQTLDEMNASQNLRHFLNLLNRACFGTAARRKNMSVEVIPVLEKSYSGRLHYHLTLRNPNPKQAFFFQQRIADCWKKTDFADAQIDIQIASDVSGWNRYITKDRRTNIDWENYHAAR
jgi:hypothetical protein